MSRILITGGAGFIGTALANRLKNLNHDVTIIDLEKKFTSLHDGFDEYSLDIRNYENFKKIEHLEFDYIFHLAAQTASAISQEEPELDVDTNVKGTLNICNYARKCKVKKIIFTSSMATYGNKEGKIKESDIQTPLSNYGVSKVAGEYYINMFGIKSTIFRLFNVYGPGQDMSNLRQGMAQSIISEEIKVTGSFERYRDFVYIDDVVDALILGLDNITDGQVYNVGSEKATTVKELIDLIIEVNDKPKSQFKITNIGSHEGDQFGSKADATKLKSLGWTPKTNLKDGLEKMYIYAKEVLVALLTGRGNNTLSDKNILPVLGKPLISYPANAAKNVKSINHFYVSSDDDKILDIAYDLGYKKIKRPDELASPTAKHMDAILHAVEYMKEKDNLEPDILIVFLANSATVKSEWIEKGINQILNDESITSVYQEQDHHPYRAKRLNENGSLDTFFDFSDMEVSTNRQELEPCYFWILNMKNSLYSKKGQKPWTFLGNNTKPIFVDRCFDVHTEQDLEECAKWVKSNL